MIIQFINDLEKLIVKTYDEGKKIIFFSMLKGITKSSLKFESTRNRVVELLINLLSFITSEEIYNVVSPIAR